MEANDLASALIRLTADLSRPLALLILVTCWLAGFCVFLQGCFRLIAHSEQRGRAPSAAGTALSFIIAAICVSLPQWIDAAGTSLLGDARTATAVALAYDTRAADWTGLLNAVFTIMALIGLCAAIRGVFMFRAAADGRPQATTGRAALHVLGGVCAWHMPAVIGAIQTTLGIRVLTVSN